MLQNLKSFLKFKLGEFWWQYLARSKNDFLSEVKIWRGTKKTQPLFKSINEPCKLQLGCGQRVRNGWINTDVCQNSNSTVDGILDLRRPFPLQNETCLEIYSNHVFEHVSYPDTALHVLRESHRILTPDGRFRVVVPDLDLFLASYTKPENSYYMEWVLSMKRNVVFGTRAEVMNFLFRQGGEHLYTYDFETLSKMLYQVGFKRVEKSEYQPEFDPEPFHEVSLYVNAYK